MLHEIIYDTCMEQDSRMLVLDRLAENLWKEASL